MLYRVLEVISIQIEVVCILSSRRNRQTRFSVRSGIITFASPMYFSQEGIYISGRRYRCVAWEL